MKSMGMAVGTIIVIVIAVIGLIVLLVILSGLVPAITVAAQSLVNGIRCSFCNTIGIFSWFSSFCGSC